MKKIRILILLLACYLVASAQITEFSCNGRVDTLFIENFGNALNPLPTPVNRGYANYGYAFMGGATTEYTEASSYTNNGTTGIIDGRYLVVNGNNTTTEAAYLVFNAWTKPFFDHTRGDQFGMYMVVNAETTQKKFYKFSLSGLHPGDRIFFSCYVASMMNSAPANIIRTRPNINLKVYDPENLSVILQEDSTGEVPNDQQWHEFGLWEYVPAGVTTLTFEFTNTQKKTDANDLGLDDIMVRVCKKDYLPVNPNVRGKLGE
ncbi:MAG: hypothetical protein FWD66_09005 [Paludibacter sp.]|nr:hypothetical protein [Paludibacter sp.]